MTGKLRDPRGFSLLEMGVVMIILGLIAAFSLPAYLRFNKSLQLKGAVQNLAGQLQLMRQKAIATGAAQKMHLYYASLGTDYHIHNTGQPPGAGWKLPKGVTYLWNVNTLAAQEVSMTPDGRADRSGMVILQTQEGLRDTVNVQLSGLVLVQ